jgi:hypothetical protein
MESHLFPSRGRAILVCAAVALIVLACGGLLGVAALAPAPPVVLPFVITVSLGCTMVAAWELRPWVAILRAYRLLADLHRDLAALPETEHPLGG